MIYKKKGICTLFTMCILLVASYSQTATPTAGGNSLGTGGSASYSIGQTFYTTNSGTSGFEIQGVQQPYEISVVIGLEDAKEISLGCIVYPNPTHDLLTLQLNNYGKSNLSFQLFDAGGKLIDIKEINGCDSQISMTNLPPAIYLLKIFEGEKEIKTFKIIKN